MAWYTKVKGETKKNYNYTKEDRAKSVEVVKVCYMIQETFIQCFYYLFTHFKIKSTGWMGVPYVIRTQRSYVF